ncbi:hypothetical protein HDV05_006709 [Chytridiales sp. JEL 0842]|nr:hypothetical protein HDV05_006709 [Chytridiales sp. JEL 0842]
MNDATDSTDHTPKDKTITLPLYPPNPPSNPQTEPQQKPTLSARLFRLIDPKFHNYDPTTFVTSPFFKPTTLYRIRFAIFIYMLLTGTFVATWDPNNSIFQVNKLLGLMSNFFINSISGYIYVSSPSGPERLAQRHPLLKLLQWYLYQCSTGFVLIVSLVYWTILAPGMFRSPSFSLSSLLLQTNLHAVNALIFFFEVSINNVRVYYSQWLAPIFTALLYLAYAYVWRALGSEAVKNLFPGGYYIYPFLNPKSPIFVPFFVGCVPLFLGVYCGVVWVHKWRDARRERRGVKAILSDDYDNVVVV